MQTVVPHHLPLFDFAYCEIRNKLHPERNKSFNEFLSELASIALAEDWGGEHNPILYRYVHHTFKRLKAEYDSASTEEDQNKKIKVSGDFACFNTGLFTRGYQAIFALFSKNRSPSQPWHKPWFLMGFFPESDMKLNVFGPELPERASYFTDISDLIFDYRLKIRANIEHILADTDNIQRLPEAYQDPGNREKLNTDFYGAIHVAQKKVEANYKLAIPQFYNGSVQLLIPLHLTGGSEPDLALTIKKEDSGFYMARTCLTLEMAYNNARLIAKPGSDWLKPV